MISEKLTRTTLWLSLPFNIVAGFALMFPTTALATLFGMGDPVPPFHAFFLGGIIISFGLIYGWLAQSAEINRAVLTISAIGKVSVFSAGSRLVGNQPRCAGDDDCHRGRLGLWHSMGALVIANPQTSILVFVFRFPEPLGQHIHFF